MRLLLNCERALTLVAADATREKGPSAARRAGGPAGYERRATAAARIVVPMYDLGCETEGRLDRFTELIRAAVVGEPPELHLALSEGAVGWSPAGEFACRDEAVTHSAQSVSSLSVERFRVLMLRWSEPLVFSEWWLGARQEDPLLIGEDVLIEPTGRVIELVGATVAEVRDDRVVVAHTYFDDASLIEQIILGRRRPHVEE